MKMCGFFRGGEMIHQLVNGYSSKSDELTNGQHSVESNECKLNDF